MKLLFEWCSFVLSILGIVYSIYLLYFEIRRGKIKRSRDRFYLLIFMIFTLLAISADKIQHIFF